MMKNIFYTLRFWLVFIIAFVMMFFLNLWQLGFSSFLRYPATWHELPWLSLDFLLAYTIALLAGFNLAVVTSLFQRGHAESASRAGFFGLLGVVFGYFTLYCVACQVTLFTFFGTAVAASLVAPWLPFLRVVSVLLLLVATFFSVRAVVRPRCRV